MNGQFLTVCVVLWHAEHLRFGGPSESTCEMRYVARAMLPPQNRSSPTDNGP